MSERPTLEQPFVGQTATSRADEPYGSTASTASYRTEYSVQSVPLLPRAAFAVVLALGVVLGIGGPILLWLNLPLGRNASLDERVGLLLALVGLGLVLIGLPLVLGEVARLERAAEIGTAGARPADQARGMTGARVVAIIGVVVLLAGAFLLRPVEPTDSSDGGRDRGGNNQGGGRGN